MTPIEFLTARLDEDEAFATRATDGPWWVDLWNESYSVRSPWRPSRDLNGNELPGRMNCSEVARGMTYVANSANNVAFVARNDPARVLADIAAKRAIVEMATHVEAASRLDAPEADDWMIAQEPDGWGAVIVALRHAVELLAQAYVEHPDYDEAWRT